MYACLHTPAAHAHGDELLQLALKFSPLIEQTSKDTAVFSIDALRKLIGSPHQIASEICRIGYERKIEANLAIASNPDTAILIARNMAGVNLVPPGEELFHLASIPLTRLFLHDVPVSPEMIEAINRWGLKTCEHLAALPERDIAERIGPSGVYLRNLACGTIDRPLRIVKPQTKYEESIELEHPIHLLEPLLFLFSRVLTDLCHSLRAQSSAARVLEARLELEQAQEYHCKLEFPVPLNESTAMLKLLQLHLERHSPGAPIVAFTLRVESAEARRVQEGLFLPPTPAPDKLQITLARIQGIVGTENVGVPVLLDTNRPDEFQLTSLTPSAFEHVQQTILAEEHPQNVLRLAMRLFRPALQARVRVSGITPMDVVAPGVRGAVTRSAGPWKTSGEWWAATSWMREEWDVALDDGALYRIYLEMRTHQWYVHGVYD